MNHLLSLVSRLVIGLLSWCFSHFGSVSFKASGHCVAGYLLWKSDPLTGPLIYLVLRWHRSGVQVPVPLTCCKACIDHQDMQKCNFKISE